MLKSASEVRELFNNKMKGYIDKIGDDIIRDAEKAIHAQYLK